MAKASKADINALRKFMLSLEQMCEDPDESLAMLRWMRQGFGNVNVSTGWRRVVEGADILIDEVCDPEKDYLDYKPELKQLIPEAKNEQGQRMFYLISFTHSDRGVLMFWGANNAGYTTNIRRAGRYTESQIRGNMSYYHQGDNCTAVPVDEVHDGRYKIAENVWVNYNETQRLRKRVAAGALTDEEMKSKEETL